jgi:hypothetical protein
MTAVEELKQIRDQLTDYFTKLGLNFDNAASPLPSFEDYVAQLVYDQILTKATEGADRVASYSTGSLVDTAHFVSAIQREFDMRGSTKANYFSDSIDDTDNLISYLDGLYGKYLNYYRGTSPEQQFSV